jgi:hypothetical protein
MPDLLVRDIDDALAERIKRYTRERVEPLNTCMLELLRAGLEQFEARSAAKAAGESVPGATSPAAGTMPNYGSEVMRETRILGGTWNSDEASAFREAMAAIERIPGGSGI